jgi:hypothetical protein
MTEQTAAQARMAAVRAARKPRTAPFNGADPAAFDHDGNGEAGGSLPVDAVARAKAQRAAREAAELAAAQRDAKSRASMPRPDADGPTGLQRAAAKTEYDAAAREEAARAMIRGAAGPEMVRVRVTKQGDSKVSTGQHAPGIGEVHYAWKEEFDIPRSIAEALETRYFVEIL